MQNIVPFLWFANEAEEAVNFYVSIFKNSKIERMSRYAEGGPGPVGAVMTVDFQLEGQNFMAVNGGAVSGDGADDTPPRGGIALFVNCETQDEVDRLWDALAVAGKQLPCGWVKDKYGFTWNIVPAGLGDVLGDDDTEKAQRAMKAMLNMKKLDINALRLAANSR